MGKTLGDDLDLFRSLGADQQELIIEHVDDHPVASIGELRRLIEHVASYSVVKYCKKCRRHKPLKDFYHDRTKPDGYMYDCRGCTTLKRAKSSFPQARRHETVIRTTDSLHSDFCY